MTEMAASGGGQGPTQVGYGGEASLLSMCVTARAVWSREIGEERRGEEGMRKEN
jgi:hypothetical protein